MKRDEKEDEMFNKEKSKGEEIRSLSCVYLFVWKKNICGLFFSLFMFNAGKFSLFGSLDLMHQSKQMSPDVP